MSADADKSHDTLIPTMGLRFQRRKTRVAHPEYGGGTYEKDRFVLQQRFTAPNGTEVWRDVPTVEEPGEYAR